MSAMGEMQVLQPCELPRTAEQQMLLAVEQMARGINDLALMLKVTNDRMDALEKEVRRLTKVTPAQATAINQAIKQRASELCQQRRAEGCERLISGAIRKSLKLGCGIGNVRELPRGDFALAMQRIQAWDDYRLIRDIKAKEAAKHGQH